MKFLPLIFANLLRKKIRTLLTLGSFAVALFLFGLLAVVGGAFSDFKDVAGADRMVVVNKTSIIEPLPISYRDRLLRIPGVQQVTYSSWFGGVYQDEKNVFPQYAIDPENQLGIFRENIVPSDQWREFTIDRQGAVVGEDLAKRFGWKIGDRIPIKGTYYPGVWEFNIRGLYHTARKGEYAGEFWFQWDYLRERSNGKGYVGWYYVRLSSPDQAAQIAKSIDREFSNSPWETKTDVEKAVATARVKQLGNIQLLMLSIGGVVFFTLLLVTGNTIAMAVRERIGELAILKALGYFDAFVLVLVLAESLFVAAAGGGLGLLAAKLFTLSGTRIHGLFPRFYLSPGAMLSGLAISLGVGVVAGILPALSAMRLGVVDALRRA